MFRLVLQSNRDELSRQLHQAIGDHDATAFFKDGLSALQAYMLFVLHYLENYLTTAGLHAWPVISHNNLRSMTDRVAFTKTFSRPWNEIQGSEVAEVVQFLISRFVNQPSVPIGEREIGLLAKALLASKIPYQQMFVNPTCASTTAWYTVRVRTRGGQFGRQEPELTAFGCLAARTGQTAPVVPTPFFLVRPF